MVQQEARPLSDTPELSVVVLFYRAEDLARKIFSQITKELENAGVDYELILVGNYFLKSEDKTPEILEELAGTDPRIKVVAKAKEGMMGWDMRSGLAACTGSHLAVIDGDGQMPMSDIMKVYRVLQIGGYDLVKTIRLQRFDGLYRKIISVIYNSLFRILYSPRLSLHDVNSKPKVMTRAAYAAMTLRSNDWFADAEIMIEAIRNKLRIGEVSTVFYKNEHRDSLVPAVAILEFIINLIAYRFSKKAPGNKRDSGHGVRPRL
jgi:glycosyltransferase involved in cell wall biosynthesis